ncbi:MAG: tetratricopeptide repeat protein [Ignavibacteriae bacterium]|nr:tetratricopeptide repeat protein [Ignavibacteriota bacterium]
MKIFKILSTLIFLNSFFLFAQSNVELYSSAMEQFNRNEYSYALNVFQKIITIDEVENRILSSSEYHIAECLMGIEQEDGAISQYEHFLSEYPHSNYRETALYKLGSLQFNRNNFSQARNSLSELVDKYPSSTFNGSAYYLIGESFILENDLVSAEKFFRTAVAAGANNSFVDYSIYSLANVYEKKEDYINAVKYYDKLLGFHSTSKLAPQAQVRIGVCYFNLKEYDNAVLELSDPLVEELSNVDKNEADFVLASTFYRLKEYNNASVAYKRILRNEPKPEMLNKIRYGLAWINFQSGKYLSAFNLFNDLANSNNSLSVKSLYWSGEAKRYAGQHDEAIQIHKTFADKYPNDPLAESVRLNIGISKFKEESFSDSEETLLKSVDSDNPLTKAKSFTLLGEINLRKKEYKTSSEYFKRGLMIPQIAQELKDRCHLGLGVSYFFLKNNVKALQEFNQIDITSTKVDLNKLNFYLGEANFFLGNFNKAISNYSKVKSDDRLLLKNMLYGKAYSFFNSKEFSKAAFVYKDFISKYASDRRRNECELRLADCYYGTKDFAKASAHYKNVLENTSEFSKDERAFFNYAQSLFKFGDATAAIEILDGIQLRFPNSKYADDSQYLIGWIYFQRAEFDNAISSYKKLFDQYPSSPTLPIAYYSIGDSYFNKGDYSKAINSYKNVISDFPNSQYVYDAVNGIQYCYIVQDKQSGAIKYLDEFISSNSGYSFIDKIRFVKAEIFYNSGDYNLAVSSYGSIIDNHPESKLIPSAYYWMGKSEVLLGNPDKGINYFEVVRSTSLDTEIGFNSVLEAGKIYREKKNLTDEINLYDEVISKLGNSKRLSELNFIKAQAYLESNDIPSAYQAFNEVLRKPDASLFYHKAELELGLLELARGNFENAFELFDDISKNRKDDIAAQALYFKGVAQFDQENYNGAVETLIRVRSLYASYDEWYSKSLMKLGDTYVELGDKKNASEMYKGVLKKHPRDLMGKEAKEKLKSL